VGIRSEFKEFALKGSAVDLAVGVILGAAFGKIVDSLVGDIIMPLISKLFGKLDFSYLYLPLSPVPENIPQTYASLKAHGVSVVGYGSFITIVLNFFILLFVIFLMVKQMNKIKKAELGDLPTSDEVQLLREIRDSLQKKSAP